MDESTGNSGEEIPVAAKGLLYFYGNWKWLLMVTMIMMTHTPISYLGVLLVYLSIQLPICMYFYPCECKCNDQFYLSAFYLPRY